MSVEQSIDHINADTRGKSAALEVTGEFVDLHGERYYAIRDVDRMAPFFVSVVSNDDHWLFTSSTGGLTAGRISPEMALFPYITVDKIHDSTTHTGSLTMIRVRVADGWQEWDPFSEAQGGRSANSRNIYKNLLGNKLCFEEINHDLELAFRYTWLTSDRYGFVRLCELENLRDEAVQVEMLDGLQNILPAGTPRFAQMNSSNLVDAYKWTEYDPESGLALFTLYSGITDRAEPCESLKANIAYCLGLNEQKALLSTEQLLRFRNGLVLDEEHLRRGIRGAFLVNARLSLGPRSSQQWLIVANTEQTQPDAVALQKELANPEALATAIHESVDRGSDGLARIMASGDAFQATSEETVTAHHYANVLFNVLRGGVFFDQYQVSAHDLRQTIRSFNGAVYDDNRTMLEGLPDRLEAAELLDTVRQSGDEQLQRLCYEYLPITFGRRHGDPSRPWNQFAIRLRNRDGDPCCPTQGNWRDIFQNWEALAFSFPEFVESMIAKFVNASTVDGYNPYRITKEGIDWEVEDPEDPWSYIGYWGDHQIIYLQKLLELSRQFHPDRLGELLHQPAFCYANVPYRIRRSPRCRRPEKHRRLRRRAGRAHRERVERMGADGKLVLVTMTRSTRSTCSKNCSCRCWQAGQPRRRRRHLDEHAAPGVERRQQRAGRPGPVDGDAVLSAAYMQFLDEILAGEQGPARFLPRWPMARRYGSRASAPAAAAGQRRDQSRAETCHADRAGPGSQHYRDVVYRNEGFSAKVDHLGGYSQPARRMRWLLSITALPQTGAMTACSTPTTSWTCRNGTHIARLYPMLEGQVAALSTGSMAPGDAIEVLDALFDSGVYRGDQQSFHVVPGQEAAAFLKKNVIPAERIESTPLLRRLVDAGDERIVLRTLTGTIVSMPILSTRLLDAKLDELAANLRRRYVESAREPVAELYEEVFNHRAFTGRSGTMFGFRGLGCIYWHMVSKLLLAVQENFFVADRLRTRDSAAAWTTLLPRPTGHRFQQDAD